MPPMRTTSRIVSHMARLCKALKKPQVVYHDFDFHCEPCNRDYTLKDNILMDKAPEIISNAEDKALEPIEKENTVDYRCPECGDPIMKYLGTSLLICLWCNREYMPSKGDLQLAVRALQDTSRFKISSS